MSLRRSARTSTTTPLAAPEATAPVPAAVKKRKSRASKPAPEPGSSSAGGSFLSGTDIKPNNDNFAIPEAPRTPLPKRRKPAESETLQAPPPFTPTPSGISLLTGSAVSSDVTRNTTAEARPAEPHVTNAPLSTPGGSRVVAYTSLPTQTPSNSQTQAEVGNDVSPTKKRKAKEIAAPDVGALPPPTSTTDSLLKDACEYLCKVDPKLKHLIDAHHCKMFSPEGLREVVDPFTALSSGIIGQQTHIDPHASRRQAVSCTCCSWSSQSPGSMLLLVLDVTDEDAQVSGQAAKSIRAKFCALFLTDPAFPSPAQVTALDIPTLRTAGLSQRKAEYIQGLAEKFTSGELSAQMLIDATDEELIEKLVAVRGLGRWSVEMFACFGLKRMDVFSTGDLGVQRGMAHYAGKDVSKLKAKGGKWKYMSEKEMLDGAAKFSPYRSLFMWYMWRIEDVDISVMQNS
ncbi:DNA glycosylase [Polyplosphaeria fusca]|uniref:DNA glycosylase n=1 Tax=Polyplosphaeria fusca TaxID=682080 RepID=A0A9P4RCQ8_9PLEO|nr:DNA glycosylase [Polyplosphaeria fusca]